MCGPTSPSKRAKTNTVSFVEGEQDGETGASAGNDLVVETVLNPMFSASLLVYLLKVGFFVFNMNVVPPVQAATDRDPRANSNLSNWRVTAWKKGQKNSH